MKGIVVDEDIWYVYTIVDGKGVVTKSRLYYQAARFDLVARVNIVFLYTNSPQHSPK